jgi:hypothetical protein
MTTYNALSSTNRPTRASVEKNKKKGHGRSAESSGHMTPSLLATSSSTSPLHESHGNLATNPCTGHSTTCWTSSAHRFNICTTNRPKKIHIQQHHYKLLLTPNHSRMLNKWQINSGSTWYIFSHKLSKISATNVMILYHNNLILFHTGTKINWRHIVPK